MAGGECSRLPENSEETYVFSGLGFEGQQKKKVMSKWNHKEKNQKNFEKKINVNLDLEIKKKLWILLYSSDHYIYINNSIHLLFGCLDKESSLDHKYQYQLIR